MTTGGKRRDDIIGLALLAVFGLGAVIGIAIGLHLI